EDLDERGVHGHGEDYNRTGSNFMHTVLLALAFTLQAPPVAPLTDASEAVAEAYYLFLEGQALEDRSDLEGAANFYRQALVLVPDAAGVRAELATIYAQQGDLTRARTEAERAIEAEPEHATAHRLLGLLAAASLDGVDATETTA